ncbi:hypothetical protein [Mycobacterium xenopi]|uniref:hypothetical protein n=1 Tax=Mycobacterium xenopi TaxID=1789 RepID=UPI000A15887A|nr:hypothetical protein [Mycobacterium xenopi]ORX11372.1 hypothetical protein AWC32_16800 [Mycobacterium xenopi]
MEFSQRYLAALNAYEAYVIIRDLHKRLEDAFAQCDSTHFYIEVFDFPSCYIEVTWNRREQARQALEAALEHYRQHFWAAVQNQAGLKEFLLPTGLPYPADLRTVLRASALGFEPKWKQILAGGYQASRQRYRQELPEGKDVVLLNVPDPFAAIEVQRAYGARRLAAIKPVEVSSDKA